MRHPIERFLALGIWATLIALAACGQGSIRSESNDDEEIWREDEGIRRSWRRRFEKLDVLFVIDDSQSMSEEQEVLADELRQIAESIVLNGIDGYAFSSVPIEDVHFGVVTSDLGSGEHEIMTCDELGDDGVLQRGSDQGCRVAPGLAEDCPSGDCPWIWHMNDLSDDGCSQADFPTMDDLLCLASFGAPGCGFSQPLEAAARALTVQAGPGGPNEGFLRADAGLMIIFITDDDDCSLADPALYDPAREDLGPMNRRCAMHPELLRPVEEYAEIFSSLAPDRTRWVDVAIIGGLPRDDDWMNASDPAAALADASQDLMGEPSIACETRWGSAMAPVRLVRLMQIFGQGLGNIASICETEWQTVTRDLDSFILPGLGWCPACPMLSGDQAESCHFVETLPDDRPCPHLVETSEGRPCGPGWHIDLGLDDQGRRRCELLPSDRDGDGRPDPMPGAAPSSCDLDTWSMQGCIPGWIQGFGDEELCLGGQIYFNVDAEAMMSPHSTLRLECQDAPCQEYIEAWERFEEEW
jgi:hypothetical protein